MGDQTQIPDPAQSILTPLRLDESTKALAWDAFHDAANEDEFATKAQTLNLPNEIKASLWEAKRAQKVHTTPATQLTAPRPTPVQPTVPTSWNDSIQANLLTNVGKGAGKSLMQTLSTGSQYSDALDPIFRQAGVKPEEMQNVKDSLTDNFQKRMEPQGTAQKVGAGLEQAGELFLGGKLMPRGSSVITRMGASGAVTGADAILHGQDPRPAVLLGAGGSLLGELTRLAGTKATQTALNSTNPQAKAVLSELTGVTPKQISKQAAVKSLALTGQMEQLASNSNVPASTKPALDIIDKEMAKATAQNNQPYFDNLGKLKLQLTQEFSTGNPIPQNVPAKQILDLKRGVGGLINSWDAPARNSVRTVTKQVYAALDNELDKAAPGAGELNDRISSLIGAGKAATKTSKMTLNTVLRQAAARSVGAAVGGTVGHDRGGAAGALKGAALGALLSSPTSAVAASRVAASPITGSVIKGLALQVANSQEEK